MFLKCLLLFTNFFALNFVSASNIKLSSDAPVTIGTPVTFSVNFRGQIVFPRYVIKLSFAEFPEKNSQHFEFSPPFNYPVLFTKEDCEKQGSYGPFSVTVEVWGWVFVQVFWGTDSTTFTLSDSLIISIDVDQKNASSLSQYKHPIVSTAKETVLTANVKDSTGYFKKLNFSYEWDINSVSHNESTLKSIYYNFTAPQINNVSVYVNASEVNSTTVQFGSQKIFIVSQEPITNITLDGKTFVHRDETLNLKLNVDGGSPPFYYCWEIRNASSDLSKDYDYSSSCGEIDKSSFEIIRYFSQKGKYNLTVSLHNAISNVSRLWMISIYDIKHQAQLSFVLIPVCSIIAAILIIMGGIAIHMRQRKELTIEVADFDFQSYEDLMEKTFFERIRENFTHSMKQSFLTPCIQRNEYDELENSVNNSDCDTTPSVKNFGASSLRSSEDT